VVDLAHNLDLLEDIRSLDPLGLLFEIRMQMVVGLVTTTRRQMLFFSMMQYFPRERVQDN
jgi:hypothetical protein